MIVSEKIQQDIQRETHAQSAMKPQFISVVAYVHNDREKVEAFIDVVVNRCRETFKYCELIFVDDHSLDDSVQVIKGYFKRNPTDYIVSIIRLGHYHGMETAMNAGRDMAIGDYVYEFDDLYVDFSADVVVEAYEKCLEGNDVVVASTDVPMRATSKLFYNLFNKVTTSFTQIGQESFRLISRRGINRITSMDAHIPYRKVIYLNCGLACTQIKYKSTTGTRPPRIAQKSERIDLAFESFVYFTDLIERISLGLSIGFACLSVATVMYAVISGCMGWTENNWMITVMLLSIGMTGLFGMMTIIIKYLAILLDLLFKRQEYLITDVDKISSK